VYAEFLRTTATSQVGRQSVADAIQRLFLLPEAFVASFRHPTSSAREHLELHNLPPWLVEKALDYGPFRKMAVAAGTRVRPRTPSAVSVYNSRPLWPSLSSPGPHLCQLNSVATAATAATGASAAAPGTGEASASKINKAKRTKKPGGSAKSEATPQSARPSSEPTARTDAAAPATHSVAPSAVPMNSKFGTVEEARLDRNMHTLRGSNWFNDEVCPRVW